MWCDVLMWCFCQGRDVTLLVARSKIRVGVPARQFAEYTSDYISQYLICLEMPWWGLLEVKYITSMFFFKNRVRVKERYDNRLSVAAGMIRRGGNACHWLYPSDWPTAGQSHLHQKTNRIHRGRHRYIIHTFYDIHDIPCTYIDII